MKNKFYILCLVVIMFSGCTKDAKTLQNKAAIDEKKGIVIINNGKEKTYTEQNEITQQDNRHELAEDRATVIANEINKNTQIKKSAVVVTGNTAIVGLTLNEELTDGKLVELKRLIEKTVKKIDLEIDHVAVSSAPDLYGKILDASGNTDKEREELKEDEGVKENEDVLFRLIPTI